jgi:hypothetical protein
MTSTQTTLNHVNKALSALVNGKYLNSIPLDAIFAAVRENIGEVLDVDNTPLGGVILCGESGAVHFAIRSENGRNFSRKLHISWYTMQSGRYEVIAYVS